MKLKKNLIFLIVTLGFCLGCTESKTARTLPRSQPGGNGADLGSSSIMTTSFQIDQESKDSFEKIVAAASGVKAVLQCNGLAPSDPSAVNFDSTSGKVSVSFASKSEYRAASCFCMIYAEFATAAAFEALKTSYYFQKQLTKDRLILFSSDLAKITGGVLQLKFYKLFSLLFKPATVQTTDLAKLKLNVTIPDAKAPTAVTDVALVCRTDEQEEVFSYTKELSLSAAPTIIEIEAIRKSWLTMTTPTCYLAARTTKSLISGMITIWTPTGQQSDSASGSSGNLFQATATIALLAFENGSSDPLEKVVVEGSVSNCPGIPVSTNGGGCSAVVIGTPAAELSKTGQVLKLFGDSLVFKRGIFDEENWSFSVTPASENVSVALDPQNNFVFSSSVVSLTIAPTEEAVRDNTDNVKYIAVTLTNPPDDAGLNLVAQFYYDDSGLVTSIEIDVYSASGSVNEGFLLDTRSKNIKKEALVPGILSLTP